jgi:predicted permease
MRHLNRLLARLRGLIRVSSDEERLRLEIEEHLALQTAENVKVGMPPTEARRQAALKFGAVEAVKEEYRNQRVLPPIEAVLQDTRHAFRRLRNSPGFALTAMTTLALGIGANTAIFSVADGLLLRPLPVLRPSEIVTVNPGSATPTMGGNSTVSYPDYRDYRDRNRSFDGLLAFQYGPFGYAPNRTAVPEIQFGAFVSANFFQVLGVEPTLGRGFRRSEDEVPGRDRVAVVSHDFWLGHLNGAPSAIGCKVLLNGHEFMIVGVAPAKFTGIDQFVKLSIFVPIAASPLLSAADNLNKRDVRWLNIKGRLKPGVTNTRAEADLNAIAKVLEQTYSSRPAGQKIRVETELALRIEHSPPDAALIAMLTLLAISVLLVACANVAGLLLSRATVRAREVALRLAIGAGRWQLIRLLFVENLLLALGGGIFGILIGVAGIRLFSRIPVPTDVPVSFHISLDQRALLFTLIVSVASTFLFGLLPALRSSRSDLISALKTRDCDHADKGRLWGRNALVCAQLAVSLVLLVVSTIVFYGFRSQLQQGPGYQTDHLLLASFDTQLVHYSKEQSQQFYRQLLNRARSAAGTRSAALSSNIPFSFDAADDKPMIPEGHTLRQGEQPPTVFNSVVSEGYFETMQIPILLGRGFLESDKPDSARVAVVNEHFANRFWPHENAIGKRFRLQDASGPLVQIVGIAKQGKYVWIAEPPVDFLYLPFSQNQQNDMTLIAESTAIDAGTVAPVVRKLVHGLDPNMPVFDLRTMQDLFTKRAVETPNIIVEAVAAMGVMALILAVIGLYGLVSYTASRRTHEIGIRMAIGADQQGVLKMILRQGLVLTLSGTAVGLIAGVAASRLLRSMFILSFGNAKPALFLAITLPLLSVAMLAAYTPARRASRIDPLRALREE